MIYQEYLGEENDDVFAIKNQIDTNFSKEEKKSQ